MSVKEDQTDWEHSATLEDRVIEIFRRKETQLDEFQSYLRIFGREKLEKIWNDYKDRGTMK